MLGGALGFFAVLCFHFPQLLTAPVLRSYGVSDGPAARTYLAQILDPFRR